MSRRITLTDFEIEQLIAGLKDLGNQGNGAYEVVAVGRHFYNELTKKLKGQHPRSVETLGVSGNGDTPSLPQTYKEK